MSAIPVFELIMEEEPRAKQPRFASVGEEEVDVIIEERHPLETKRATEKWCKVFKDYATEKNLAIDLSICSPEELSNVLAHFYMEVRRQDGQPYQRNSLLSCRGAIQRHLASLDRTINIFKDKAFTRANAALDGQLKRLKREGALKLTQHKEPISSDDMAKLKAYFSSDNTLDAVKLTEQCWFVITYHFSLRARELQCQMSKNDLVLHTDEKGSEYYSLATDFLTKNHQGGIRDGSSPVSAGRI